MQHKSQGNRNVIARSFAALLPKEKNYRFSVSDALYVLVYPDGDKNLVWKYRFSLHRYATL